MKLTESIGSVRRYSGWFVKCGCQFGRGNYSIRLRVLTLQGKEGAENRSELKWNRGKFCRLHRDNSVKAAFLNEYD